MCTARQGHAHAHSEEKAVQKPEPKVLAFQPLELKGDSSWWLSHPVYSMAAQVDNTVTCRGKLQQMNWWGIQICVHYKVQCCKKHTKQLS